VLATTTYQQPFEGKCENLLLQRRHTMTQDSSAICHSLQRAPVISRKGGMAANNGVHGDVQHDF
jgi:hypothetical protein